MKIKTLKTITSHPLTKKHKLRTLVRFFKRGLVVRLCPYPIAYPFIDKTRLLVTKGMSSAELQIYTGIYDFYEMFFVLHYLHEDDLFVDVGANVGVYTVLASGVKGSRCISFEPIPKTFLNLQNNIAINNIGDKVKALNMGVGNKKQVLKFSKNLNSSVNHVISESENNNDIIEIQVDSLDSILEAEFPSILKIDVEGYEMMVIEGAMQTLKKESLKAIIIELNGLANNYGFDEQKIHQILISNGFNPYSYDPYQRSLTKLGNFGVQNTIYLRDLNFINDRLHSSGKFKVLNLEI
jgi:FkbM family methyltransferase